MPELRGWNLIPIDAERATCRFCGEDIATWERDGTHLFWHRLPSCRAFLNALEPLKALRVL